MVAVMRKKLQIVPFVVALSTCAIGCSSHPGSGEDQIGEAQLAITNVPPSVQCIQVVVTGSQTVTRNLTVTSGSSSVALALGQLPLGNVTITGSAFSQACTAISGQTPTWIADPQQTVLQAGLVSSLTITFRQNNAVSATANFAGNVTQVAVGAFNVSVVLSDGTVRAAGYYWLASGTSFAQVANLTSVSQLTMSDNFGCAIYNGGLAECFGYGNEGELGNGTNGYAGSPVPVTGLTGVTQIAAGFQHACALLGSQVQCWGSNTYGQLGTSNTTSSNVPVAVSYSMSSLAAGWYHTCGIEDVAGAVDCWGENNSGQVGNGATGGTVLSPTRVDYGYTQVVAGYGHTCGLRGDGSVRCWGDNTVGQLGGGSSGSSAVPVTVPGLTSVAQLVGLDQSTCARLKNGTVWCWGQGFYGQLGNGLTTSSATPVQVPVPPSAALSARSHTVCSLGTNQSVYCWGDNESGQFGNGSKAAGLTPVQILSP
jgi:alpha-tubulin suppressor-like RCC1 family protein